MASSRPAERRYTAAPSVPACSVIVCTRYRGALLERCLRALASLDHPNYEVVVVDNTPGDPETERVVRRARVRYIRETRTGLSRARNAGARAGGGELIAFIDDDAIAEPAWLRCHQAALADPSLAASTGRILPISSNPSAGSARARLVDLGATPFLVDRATPAWFEIANFGGLGFGGNMVFKHELFDAGFGFRESLGAGAPLGAAEELNAFFRIIRDGHRVAYVPEAIVRHDEPNNQGSRRAQEIDGARRYSAYLSMLLVEEPEFRGRTSRHILEALGRPPRPWRRTDATAREAGRLRILAAACGGPLLYLRAKRRTG